MSASQKIELQTEEDEIFAIDSYHAESKEREEKMPPLERLQPIEEPIIPPISPTQNDFSLQLLEYPRDNLSEFCLSMFASPTLTNIDDDIDIVEAEIDGRIQTYRFPR